MTKILHALKYPEPVILTKGNFDGVHKGHQALLNRVVSLSQSLRQPSAVITFRNHPSTVLRPQHATPLVCTIEHRLRLLQEQGIDLVFLIDFTPEFASQPPEKFLSHLKQNLPFTHLILGHDAHFGKDREGSPQAIQSLSKKLHFQVEYLAPYQEEGHIVSSSTIRKAIQEGNFDLAEKLLGRAYSIYEVVQSGAGRGQTIGFPTANLEVEHLCLPPWGVYAVQVKIEKESIWGVANLGIAPTVRQENKLLLEVHLLDHTHQLYGQGIEVIFRKFLRQEKKFDSLDELKTQIGQDILLTRQYSQVT